MGTSISRFQQRIESGQLVVTAELSPPLGADPAAVREAARRIAGKVHALAFCDNRDRVGMSALAAAAIAIAEGVEPILHVVTRDRNRIALVSDCLGAQALGVRNLLCTTGTHQTLGHYRAARNVFDIDSVQLLETYAQLGNRADLVGETSFGGVHPLCLGAVASPDAEPAELQWMKLQKKIRAGAKFLITQPVYDLERFEAWWKEVTRRGIDQQVAILAGIHPLPDLETARAMTAKRPLTIIPEAVLSRLAAKPDPAAQRAEGVAIAAETIKRLRGASGLRGLAICGDGHFDAVVEVLEKSELEVN